MMCFSPGGIHSGAQVGPALTMVVRTWKQPRACSCATMIIVKDSPSSLTHHLAGLQTSASCLLHASSVHRRGAYGLYAQVYFHVAFIRGVFTVSIRPTW